MRSRAFLLLVLAVLAGVLAYQQATRPPRYTSPAPTVRPPPPPAPAPVAVVDPGPPPAAVLEEINQALLRADADAFEPTLRELHANYPNSAEVLTLLARYEYGRAVAGYSQPMDGGSVRFDGERMAAAERWADQAVKADPGLAEAWIASSRVALARMSPRASLELLARAEALDPDSVMLRLRKGDTLRALAAYTGDDTHLPDALVEYERIIQEPVDTPLEWVALRQMGEVHAALGNDAKAVAYLTRAIDGFEGRDLAFALESRARLHLQAGRVDEAIRDSRASLEVMRFPVAANTLADALLVRTGLAVRNKNQAAAVRDAMNFLALSRDPTPHLRLLASRKSTFPAVYALYATPMRAGRWDRIVPDLLVEAAGFISARELRDFASRGVTFDGGDTVTASLLFSAIAADNVDAVRELLALGADTSVLRDDGATLLDAARIGTQPRREQIRRLLLDRMGRPEGWTDVPVDLPKKGHWYRAERTIGERVDPNRKLFEAGMVLMAGGHCSTPGRPYTCFTVYTAPEQMYATILVPISRPEDLNALREVEPPAR